MALGVGHPRNGVGFDGTPTHFCRMSTQLDDLKHVVHLDERHLQVKLGELRLAVGPRVLVAQAAGDLEVLVVPGHHEQLLVELRTLRQGVPLAVVEPARDEVVAGPFRGALAEQWRLDFQEALGVQVVADHLAQPVAQDQSVLKGLAPQVEVTVMEPDVLVGQVIAELGDLERRRRAGIQDAGRGHLEFDGPGRELRVRHARGPGDHFAGDAQDVFAAEVVGDGHEGRVVGLDDDLGEAVAVAEVHEDLVVVTPVGIHPPVQGDGLPDVGIAEFAAGVGPLPVGHWDMPLAKSLESDCYSDGGLGRGVRPAKPQAAAACGFAVRSQPRSLRFDWRLVGIRPLHLDLPRIHLVPAAGVDRVKSGPPKVRFATFPFGVG